MKVLLINTCGAEGVVGLGDETGVLVEERLPGRGTSESLVPALRRLLTEDVRAVGVVDGPGSFTGVRVGLSAAKGLCEARGIPMVAMSRLALVAGDDGLALLDAGRGEYCCGFYVGGAKEREEILRPEQFLSFLGDYSAVTCEARVWERVAGIRLVEEPGAAAMLAMMQRRMAAGAWTDVALADANYLRRTDAELLVNEK